MGSVSSWCCAVLTQVLYRPEGQASGMLYTTVKQSIDLPMKKGEYLVEVRAHSEGGDGPVGQVRIAGKTSAWRHYAPFHFIQNKDWICSDTAYVKQMSEELMTGQQMEWLLMKHMI